MWNPFKGSFFVLHIQNWSTEPILDYVYLKVTAKILQKSRKCTML